MRAPLGHGCPCDLRCAEVGFAPSSYALGTRATVSRRATFARRRPSVDLFRNSADWKARAAIAAGVAKKLDFLHGQTGRDRRAERLARLAMLPLASVVCTPRPHESLDTESSVLYKVIMERKTYTTEEAAAAAGISRQTLQTWISRRKFRAPPIRIRGSHAVRVWSAEDVARLRRTKARIFLKDTGRPRKKRSG